MIIRHANTERSVPGKASQFTGDALGDSILPATDGIIINQVSFSPGSRTHWHEHESGQILLVVSGYGLICSEGESPRTLRPGDWVWIPAGERHWHGAGPDSYLTHTAISLGATRWSREVTAEEYSEASHESEGHHHDQ